jgi:hypothetical protein
MADGRQRVDRVSYAKRPSGNASAFGGDRSPIRNSYPWIGIRDSRCTERRIMRRRAIQRRRVGACAAAWNRFTVTTMAGRDSCGQYTAAACSPMFRGIQHRQRSHPFLCAVRTGLAGLSAPPAWGYRRSRRASALSPPAERAAAPCSGSFCRDRVPPPQPVHRQTARQLVDVGGTGAQPGTRPDEVRWDSRRTSPILAPGRLAKLWALREGACARLAPVLRPPAANGDVAACPTAVLAPVRAPRAADGGVAACPKVWVRALSMVRRHRTDPGRADRVRLCREDEDCGRERQRGEGGGQPGTPAGTGLLSRHDHSSFRDGTWSPVPSRRVLRACCGSRAIRLQNGCGRKICQEPQVAW